MLIRPLSVDSCVPSSPAGSADPLEPGSRPCDRVQREPENKEDAVQLRIPPSIILDPYDYLSREGKKALLRFPSDWPRATLQTPGFSPSTFFFACTTGLSTLVRQLGTETKITHP